MADLAQARLGAKTLEVDQRSPRIYPDLHLAGRLADLPSRVREALGRALDTTDIKFILSDRGEIVVARARP